MTAKPALPKRLPLRRVRAGSRWMRIHAPARNALWFGPGSGRQPIHRFDDPAGRFRVCYLGTTIEVCFAETFLRNPPVRILALDDLAGRSIATVEVRRILRLAPVYRSSVLPVGGRAGVGGGGAPNGNGARTTRALNLGRGPCGTPAPSRPEPFSPPATTIRRSASPCTT